MSTNVQNSIGNMFNDSPPQEAVALAATDAEFYVGNELDIDDNDSRYETLVQLLCLPFIIHSRFCKIYIIRECRRCFG